MTIGTFSTVSLSALRACTSLLFVILSNFAHAHEGHGLSGAHLHASDVLVVGITIALAAFMIWRGKR